SLVLLKTKYGRVDAKISYIGRRAELALYSQAFSAWEYRNPQTLSRRLHSLVVKLHLNNLAAKEDVAFAAEQARLLASSTPRKRKSDAIDHETLIGKRARLDPAGCASSVAAATCQAGPPAPQSSSALFFNGNGDLLQLVCSFLAAPDVLQCASTCSQAASQLPAFVTTIHVTTAALQTLSMTHRASFFRRFLNLESFTLTGQMEVQQFNFQDEESLIARNVLVRSLLQALSGAQLPKLAAFALNFCYSEGLQDHITSQVATVLAGPSSRFPLLHTLSLVGNCIADDGVMSLYDALALPRDAHVGRRRLALLDLSQNFIGERGHVQMQELVALFAASGSPLIVDVRGNLLTVAPLAAPVA
ncbi:hypothetical protein BBJ28_00025354, partial [Nothophytophthora sp. Chile5]